MGRRRFDPLSLLLAAIATAVSSVAQSEAFYVPRDIERAYERGTRSRDGEPGPGYWQNRADYDIRVRFDPATGLLEGLETITYTNDSPDALDRLVLDVFPNLFRRGSPRDRAIDPADVGEGVHIDALAVDGEALDLSGAAVAEQHNGLKLIVSTAVAAGEQVTLSIAWHYTVNRGSHVRTGAVDATSWFVAYFFPRISVYDDIDGWDLKPYTGNAEFYNDFGDFTVAVDVPRGFVVWATGLLRNPREVLTPEYAARWAAAFDSDAVVHVVDADDVARRGITAAAERNSWRFAAENVPDFAFAVSDHYVWDATSVVVDPASGRRVLVEAVYDAGSPDFPEVAGIARAAIEVMSERMPGVPFPFPSMTVFNGSSAMEYPMMVNDYSVETRERLVQLTAHEIFHSYFPFYMGINETKHSWMDEGWARLADLTITETLLPEQPHSFYLMERYRQDMGSHRDVPLYVGSDFTKPPAYLYNSYEKPAVVYYVLRDLLGEELFMSALREYVRRWNGKHPTPYDFFFTFEHASGEDLGWFWQPWFFEYGYADLAIAGVRRRGEVHEIVIERVGRHPVPVDLRIEYADGSTGREHAPVSVWKSGNRTWTLELPADKEIRQIELGEPNIPDADPGNDRYTAR